MDDVAELGASYGLRPVAGSSVLRRQVSPNRLHMSSRILHVIHEEPLLQIEENHRLRNASSNRSVPAVCGLSARGLLAINLVLFGK
jgi:hypothetical protein